MQARLWLHDNHGDRGHIRCADHVISCDQRGRCRCGTVTVDVFISPCTFPFTPPTVCNTSTKHISIPQSSIGGCPFCVIDVCTQHCQVVVPLISLDHTNIGEKCFTDSVSHILHNLSQNCISDAKHNWSCIDDDAIDELKQRLLPVGAYVPASVPYLPVYTNRTIHNLLRHQTSDRDHQFCGWLPTKQRNKYGNEIVTVALVCGCARATYHYNVATTTRRSSIGVG